MCTAWRWEELGGRRAVGKEEKITALCDVWFSFKLRAIGFL